MSRAVYAHDGPARVTLFTVVNKRSGSGGHSGLMVNGSERVLFDPAGTFRVPFVPERNDLLIGMTDRAVAAYVDYHAREEWDVRVQDVDVSRQEADALIAALRDYGAVPKAQCSLAITRILRDFDRFDGVGVTYFPNGLSQDFGEISGDTGVVVTDATADKSHNVRFQARR